MLTFFLVLLATMFVCLFIDQTAAIYRNKACFKRDRELAKALVLNWLLYLLCIFFLKKFMKI